MSSPLSSETMMKLMAYADGELDGKERLDTEELLATDLDALRFVEQIAGCGNLVGEGYAASATAKTVAAFDIADAVMAKVKSESRESKPEVAPKSLVPSSRISPIELARAKRAQRMKIGGGIAAALAIAAAVFVYARPSETPMAKGPSITNNPSQTDGYRSNGPGVDVNAVQTPGQNVSVFYLPSANELSTSVIIWVDESSGEKK